MYKKTSILCTRIFLGVFSLIFGWIFLHSLLLNKSYGYSPLYSLGICAASLVFWVCLFRLLQKFPDFWRRHSMKICLLVMAVTAGIQIAVGLYMRYVPSYDLDAIYGGGIAWAQTGDIRLNEYYMAYFHMFPNNLGALSLFRCIFGICGVLGVQDYFAAAVVLNVALVQGAVFCTFRIVRRLLGHTKAVFSLLLFCIFLPFYAMGAVFYTDLLSVLFPVLLYDLYLQARDQKTKPQKMALWALMGLVAGVGTLIKLTSILMLLAIFIGHLLAFLKDRKPRLSHLIQPVLVCTAVLASVLVLFQWQVSGRILQPQRLEKEAMPFSHWVAMGLINEGGYDEADYDRAMKLPSKTAREQVNRELILTRLTQPSLPELGALFTRKALRCFGDGTYGLSIFLDDGPVRWGFVHDAVLFEGKYFSVYRHMAQGQYLSIFALALAGAVQALVSVKKGRRIYQNPTPYIALFGLFCFLMLWETNARYTLNYMPVLFLCACFGLSCLPRAKAGAGGAAKQ